jgi:hypothetical protein
MLIYLRFIDGVIMTAPPADWQTLTDLTRGRDLVVERVRLAESGLAIEGAFVLPDLAKLSFDDQVFVAAFIRAHGSIKEMEQVFGVSYQSWPVGLGLRRPDGGPRGHPG